MVVITQGVLSLGRLWGNYRDFDISWSYYKTEFCNEFFYGYLWDIKKNKRIYVLILLDDEYLDIFKFFFCSNRMYRTHAFCRRICEGQLIRLSYVTRFTLVLIGGSIELFIKVELFY